MEANYKRTVTNLESEATIKEGIFKDMSQQSGREKLHDLFTWVYRPMMNIPEQLSREKWDKF